MNKTISSDFEPAWWLRSPHLQTLFPTRFTTLPMPNVEWERIELADGDFMDLAWYRHHNNDTPLVMLIHGLEGGLDSHYARTILPALREAGFNVVFLTLRGRGREPNRLPKSYHSGATTDLSEVFAHMQTNDCLPDAAVGVSLGGNLLLKYLGETGTASVLKQAIAVSIPFELRACADKLEQGFSRIYGRYLLSKLKASYRNKFSHIISPLHVNLDQIHSLYAFDDAITAPLNGFDGADDYYQRCSCRAFLKDIHTPTLIIHAHDDPFMHPQNAPTVDDTSESVTLELTRHGGHVGFVAGNVPFRPHYWLPQRIAIHLRQCLRESL